MAEQAELDLPTPSAHHLPPKAQARGFAGLTRNQMLVGALLVAVTVWSMWVTKQLLRPHQDQIVSARLSGIVGEYVQAQARSASPPGQVEAEMRKFMATLDQELQRRSANGQVVLVGEAVLTKNVPDITAELKKAVYASGIAFPRIASAQELQQLQQQQVSATQPQALAAMPSATLDPGVPALQPRAGALDPAGPAPSGPVVSSFGGAGGDDAQ
jgi:hypothetical protein